MEWSDAVITVIHLAVGFVLVFYAAKAYKKTKYSPMVFLLAGCTFLCLGETVFEDALYFIGSKVIQETIAEAFEIVGFIILILAVKKS